VHDVAQRGWLDQQDAGEILGTKRFGFQTGTVGFYNEGATPYLPRVKNRTKVFFIIAEKRCRLCSRRTTCSSVTQFS